jgi:hypothetical protein
MKLCKDCKFCVAYFRCDHPTSLYVSRPSLVTGEIASPSRISCEGARTDGYLGRDDTCGEAGRYWEPIR